jgi:superfamily II DNA or RNA helicase
MSIKTKVEIIDTEKVIKDLHIALPISKYAYNKTPDYIYPYKLMDEFIYLPFSYAMENKHDYRPKRDILPKSKFTFSGTLREEQEKVKNEALKYLNKNGSIMISCHVGFGKTIGAIKIASIIGLETLVITKGLVLLEQWKNAIDRFSPDATSQIVTPNTVIQDKNNFYIVNAINVPKIDQSLLKRIGCVIIDEAHQVMSKILSQSLQYIFPRYLIGLTATPYRPDGMGILLDIYFGKHTIYRKLNHDHIAYKIFTPYKPVIEMGENGKVNWNKILESQSENMQRNEDIIHLVKIFKDRTIMIMCKRVKQANYLVKRLQEEGESVTSLIGKQKKYEQSARILVGIIAKVGVGFDHPCLDALLLAADVEEYFIQYLGRCLRTVNVVPFIFDFVDKYKILENHSNTRDKVFLEHGGRIKNFKKEYPDVFDW